MKKELESLKTQIINKHAAIENYAKSCGIENLEEQVAEIINKFNESVISNIVYDTDSIRGIIEKWNYFKFDGYFINRKELKIVLYLSDKNFNKYEIYIYECEFVYKDKIDSEDFYEEMETILRDLNAYYASY